VTSALVLIIMLTLLSVFSLVSVGLCVSYYLGYLAGFKPFFLYFVGEDSQLCFVDYLVLWKVVCILKYTGNSNARSTFGF